MGLMSCTQTLILLVFMAWLASVIRAQQQAASSCQHEGKTYANGDFWKTETCQICTCDLSIVVCEDIICDKPICPNGTVEKPLGQCCEVCVDGNVSYSFLDKCRVFKMGTSVQTGLHFSASHL
ncbi:collagen alpha-1(III) chain-like [Arapaima gigas]